MKGKQHVIGICGGSGSGKTTFVEALKDRLPQDEICFISLDNYYLPRELQSKDANGIQNFDLPESIDAAELLKDLNQLFGGNQVVRKEYTFNNDKQVESDVTLNPKKIYVIEGLFIYHYELLKTMFDLKLFVDANDVLKVIRRIERDKHERNYPLSDVTYRYQHHVLPSYEQYIHKYKSEADIVINNNVSFEKALDVILCYISHKLGED